MTVFSPSTPSGYSIFCDDARQEDNGKQILIGVYSADMLVESFPVLLPSFRVLVQYQNESDLPVRLVITAPGESDGDLRIFEAEVPREDIAKVKVSPDNLDPFVALNLSAAFTPLVLTHPGRIKVRAYRGDDEVRLGTLRIRLRAEWQEEQRALAEGMKEAAN
jgi:hypothetical protein